jgi:hypothetical protein
MGRAHHNTLKHSLTTYVHAFWQIGVLASSKTTRLCCLDPSGLRLFVFFPELVYAAFSIDELLLAGEEGVAVRADIELHVLLGGPDLERFTAGAVNRRHLVVGMDALFHCYDLLLMEKPSHSGWLWLVRLRPE